MIKRTTRVFEITYDSPYQELDINAIENIA